MSGKIYKSYLQWLPLWRNIKETQSFYILFYTLLYYFIAIFFKEKDD